MNITLQNGRVLVSCPRCGVGLTLGPPRHKVTVGLTAGLTVTPAAMCPSCAHVFDVRRGEVRMLGQYSLPPARLAYEPTVGRVKSSGMVLAGGKLGELAEFAPTGGDSAAMHDGTHSSGPPGVSGRAIGGGMVNTPLAMAVPVPLDAPGVAPEKTPYSGDPSDYTFTELRVAGEKHHLVLKTKNKNTLMARLREHFQDGCKCDEGHGPGL